MGYTRLVESIALSDLESGSTFSFEKPLPIILTESAAFFQNEQIYIAGGFNHSRYSDFGREEVFIYGTEGHHQVVGALPNGRRMHSVATLNKKTLILGDYDARPESKALLFENGETSEYRLTGYDPNALMAATTVCFPVPIF
ncbi:Oidioi.mRNA.OKI2018_I69.PAR.g9830.t1.cds [Oikopleura dioica]|uniref:Oidioi.mRNA.OKI2018_I69.PAR.g9830.t1.cds n=1 Tax=Oikopleura dioica TaxID=34765 RepID=A0ABN7RNJ2_OIKDI|nr:Oidioi.mRNA.OKI2018_I69.PAR.g9830.t1.cds [Oikopleura dioica]